MDQVGLVGIGEFATFRAEAVGDFDDQRLAADATLAGQT